MKIQEIESPKGTRWILLDDDDEFIVPVKDYLKYLDNLGIHQTRLKATHFT